MTIDIHPPTDYYAAAKEVLALVRTHASEADRFEALGLDDAAQLHRQAAEALLPELERLTELADLEALYALPAYDPGLQARPVDPDEVRP